MFTIDYEKMDASTRRAVEVVEAKPHVRYIRYLMTKRYAPIVIKKELQKLGLSAPHEPILIKYYLAVLDPIIKESGLGKLYSDYKNKLLSNKNVRGDYNKYLLNYKLDLGSDLDMQIKFCKFIEEINIDSIWGYEITRFYGTAENIPLDSHGNRILKVVTHQRNLEIILTSPKRYVIDKLIVENIPDKRIADYCKKNLKLSVYSHDIKQYRNVFFNLQTYDLENKIRSLELEKKSLENLLSVIGGQDLDLGEKIVVKAQTEKRIEELAESIKTLNMYYTEAAYQTASIEQGNYVKMFETIVQKSFERFQNLDSYKDRDVVDVLMKVTKTMGYAMEKAEEIKERNASSSKDSHSQFELLKLYRDRADEKYKEQIEDLDKRAEFDNNNIMPKSEEINADTVGGVEELGMNYTEDEEEIAQKIIDGTNDVQTIIDSHAEDDNDFIL